MKVKILKENCGCQAAEPEMDHGEGKMAQGQLYNIALNASELLELFDEDSDLPEWLEAKITKAASYLSSASDYLAADAARDMGMLEEAEICAAGKNWVDGKTIGGQKVSRGKDGKFNNWSARAAQIASKYCKDPDYGKGRGKDAKDEGQMKEDCWDGYERVPGSKEGAIGSCRKKTAEGKLGDWEKENWTHSDGTPCGGGEKDGSDSRCKPASKWKTMSASEKKADNAKKKAGTKAGKQYVPATKKGKVTKSYTKRNENKNSKEISDKEIEDILRDEGGAAGMDPFEKNIDAAVKAIKKALENNPKIGQHEDGDYILDDDEEIRVDKEDDLEEAVYQGREVPLNKPMAGDVKKSKVYVNSGKKDKEGRIIAKKVNFGHGGSSAKAKGEKTMKIRKNNPKARKNFRARHNCDEKKPKDSPGYWSCKAW